MTVARQIRIQVKPRAKRSLLAQDSEGNWCAELKSPPVDGKANAELMALAAKTFGCHKADVTIKSGASGRFKTLIIND